MRFRERPFTDWPNILTCSRFFLSAVFVFFLLQHSSASKVLALAVFLLASFTDYWDGYLARRGGRVTGFGRLMDPIADKILTLSAFLAFAFLGLIPLWMAIAVLLRDFLVTGLRLRLPPDDPAQAARKSGKQKTVLQMALIFVALLFLAARDYGLCGEVLEAKLLVFIRYLMLFTVLVTWWSGARYLWANKKHLGIR
ncbi:MAG: CDP-diacylglycerol--glycerol-3-phosphate 3-phosphatidyltransferase [Candidatus Omnitrophica bacterium]|nr:CDP-diacylglycerol--glycerol-3-phosphate 3-phosphatidyltransferase [Candidatus Omnitrophota bacterium]